jgi:hypothetical protein
MLQIHQKALNVVTDLFPTSVKILLPKYCDFSHDLVVKVFSPHWNKMTECQNKSMFKLQLYLAWLSLWDVDIRSDNHVHYNKYLSSLEYHSWSRKLSVPEEHRRKLLCRGLALASSSGGELPFVTGQWKQGPWKGPFCFKLGARAAYWVERSV